MAREDVQYRWYTILVALIALGKQEKWRNWRGNVPTNRSPNNYIFDCINMWGEGGGWCTDEKEWGTVSVSTGTRWLVKYRTTNLLCLQMYDQYIYSTFFIICNSFKVLAYAWFTIELKFSYEEALRTKTAEKRCMSCTRRPRTWNSIVLKPHLQCGPKNKQLFKNWTIKM